MNIAADASASTLAFVEETAWGMIPDNPVFVLVRQTGNGLQSSYNKAISDEITPSASVGDLIPTSGGAEGDVNFEPSYSTFMEVFFAHALRGSFDAFGILKAGTLSKQMTLERIIPKDSILHYFRYAGCRANTLALTLDSAATSPITGTLNVMGKSESVGTEILTGATYVPAGTNPVMSMPELRKLSVSVNGTPLTSCYTTLNLSINNNLRLQQGKCTATTGFPDLTAKGTGYGRREITLEAGYYFAGLSLLEMFSANLEGSLSFVMGDGTRAYRFTLPRIKILQSSIPIEGNNSDVIQNMTLQALHSSIEETDLQIEKIANIGAGAGIKLTGTTPVPDQRGTFYKTGSLHSTKDIYQGVHSSLAIWWDTTGECWYITDHSVIGNPATAEWKNTTSGSPTGAFAAVGAATGTLSGSAYDPLA